MSALWEDRGSPAAEINTSLQAFFFSFLLLFLFEEKCWLQGNLFPAIAQSGGCSPAYAEWKRASAEAPAHVHTSSPPLPRSIFPVVAASWVSGHNSLPRLVAGESKLKEEFLWLSERMKALQKNQGRTDQMLGAMADVLTSVAMPSQQWVSCGSFSACTFCLYKAIIPQTQSGINTYGDIFQGSQSMTLPVSLVCIISHYVFVLHRFVLGYSSGILNVFL